MHRLRNAQISRKFSVFRKLSFADDEQFCVRQFPVHQRKDFQQMPETLDHILPSHGDDHAPLLPWKLRLPLRSPRLNLRNIKKSCQRVRTAAGILFFNHAAERFRTAQESVRLLTEKSQPRTVHIHVTHHAEPAFCALS